MLLWFVYGVFGIVPEVLKCLFSPVFLAFVGWLILVYFGFGRFRCFCVSCVCFCFLCCFCFCFVCFVFVFFVGLFLVLVFVLLLFLFVLLFSFVFCSCFFCFVFLGFKGQVRWPKGPPHLALNPPHCLSFCFFSLLSFLCFLNRQKTCFPPKKGHYCCSFFCVSLCLFLAFLGPPPFSLSLSWCLSCSFLSSFLSVSHFCILFLIFLFCFVCFSFKLLFCFCFFLFFFCLLSGFFES